MSNIDDSDKGKRVELDYTDDQYTKLKPGDKGTYLMSTRDPWGETQHHIRWDSGSSLSLICPPDRFHFIEEAKKNGN